MTVIAWDGKTLAADKMASEYGWSYKVTKLHRVPQGICAISGNGGHGFQLVQWLKNGADPALFPVAVSEECRAVLLLVTHEKMLHVYSTGPHPECIENQMYSRASGMDFALAAMYLGKTAREAVEVACALSAECGLGIDTLTLEG